MFKGIAGFIAIGYICGLIVGVATIADMTGASRSAWRHTGLRRRSSVTVVIIAWFILGWGAVLAGIVWFAGSTRTRVWNSYFDRADSNRNHSEQESDAEPEPRQMDFVETPAPRSQGDVPGDLGEVVEVDITEAYITE